MRYWLILKRFDAFQNAIVNAEPCEIDVMMVQRAQGVSEPQRVGDSWVTPADVRHCFPFPEDQAGAS